jgi:hypothetical protein
MGCFVKETNRLAAVPCAMICATFCTISARLRVVALKPGSSNFTTAKALGLAIPESFLMRAVEVIE